MLSFLIFNLNPKDSNPSVVSLSPFGTNHKCLGRNYFGSLKTLSSEIGQIYAWQLQFFTY